MEEIKNAIDVLQEEKQNLLLSVAKSINLDKSANKKLMELSRAEKFREVHRQITIINDLCNDFQELIPPPTPVVGFPENVAEEIPAPARPVRRTGTRKRA